MPSPDHECRPARAGRSRPTLTTVEPIHQPRFAHDRAGSRCSNSLEPWLPHPPNRAIRQVLLPHVGILLTGSLEEIVSSLSSSSFQISVVRSGTQACEARRRRGPRLSGERRVQKSPWWKAGFPEGRRNNSERVTTLSLPAQVVRGCSGLSQKPVAFLVESTRR